MKCEDTAVATVTKDGTAKFSNIGWCFHPALRFRIKFLQLLQLVILLLSQKFDTYCGGEINSVTGRVDPFLFSFFLPLSVITNTSAALRTFR